MFNDPDGHMARKPDHNKTKHHTTMADSITTITTARSISPDDDGYVTAKMLHSYMETFSNIISGGTVDWNVDAINIRCNGRNVLSASSTGNVTLGGAVGTTRVTGNTLDLEGRYGFKLYGNGEGSIVAPYLSVRGDSSVVVHSEGFATMTAYNVSLYGGRGGLRFDESVYVRGESEVTLHSPSSNVNIEGRKVTLKSVGILDLDGGTTNIKGASVIAIKSDGKLSATARGNIQMDAGANMHLNGVTKLTIHATKVDVYGTETVDIGTWNSPISITTPAELNMTARSITMRATDIAQYR